MVRGVWCVMYVTRCTMCGVWRVVWRMLYDVGSMMYYVRGMSCNVSCGMQCVLCVMYDVLCVVRAV